MKRTVIVSYASNSNHYFSKQLELIKSIKESELDVDMYMVADGGYCNEYLGVKIDLEFPAHKTKIFHRHSEIPYQFKIATIERAVDMGYEKIFWADSIFHFVKGKNIVDLLDAQESGVMAFDNLGHPLYKYISDKAVENLRVAESDLKKIPQCFGGFFGLDILKRKSLWLLEGLYKQSNLGSFKDGPSKREGFVAARHDQAAMSVLLWQYGIPLLPYGTIVYGAHHLPPYEYGQDFYGYFA